MDAALAAQVRERRADLLEQASTLQAGADLQSRALSAAEARKADEVELAIHRLDAQLGEHARTDTSLSGFRPVDGPREERIAGSIGEVLGREQSVRAWTSAHENRALGSNRSTFSEEDGAEFRLGRMISGAITGNWKDADLERRAYGESANTTGGFAVPQVLSSMTIDKLRNAAQVTNAGARTIILDSSFHSIPRLQASATGTWRAEASQVNQSSGAFDRITFRPRTLAVLARISYELSEDIIESASALITEDLVAALALRLDYGALRGSGVADTIVAAGGVAADVPLGVRFQPGVEIMSMATNGAPADFRSIVAAAGRIESRNVTPTAAIMAARTSEALGGLVDTLGQSVRVPPYLTDMGMRMLTSNQIDTNLAQGTAANASEIFVGDFTQCWIGMRPVLGIRVQQLVERFSDTMEYGLLCWLRADVQLAHPEAFTVITGVLPGSQDTYTSAFNPGIAGNPDATLVTEGLAPLP